MLGRYSDFFGAYWHDDDFGMGRYSPRDDKLGKKVWIWGLSRQGMIWEKLLTDTDGQYVEVQSGRLVQPGGRGEHADAVQAPRLRAVRDRHLDRVLVPGEGHEGLRGRARRARRACNVRPAREGGRRRSARSRRSQAVSDTLEVLDGDRVVFRTPVSREPLETWSTVVHVAVPTERLRVRIGDRWSGPATRRPGALSRPLESPKDFDWDSVQGL